MPRASERDHAVSAKGRSERGRKGDFAFRGWDDRERLRNPRSVHAAGCNGKMPGCENRIRKRSVKHPLFRTGKVVFCFERCNLLPL